MAVGIMGSLLLTGCPSSSTPPQAATKPTTPRATIVMLSGKVRTLDPAVTEATAIATNGPKIAAVGPDAEIQSWIGAETKVIDLRGRTVLPGFVDSHMHLVGLGIRRFGIDLVGTKSIEEVKGKVRDAIRKASPGDWVQGRGWDQNDWEGFKKRGTKFPSAQDLDDIAPEHPVVLHRIDGHAIWANSKAMEIAGVTPKTKTPAGGEIAKAKGKPSGIFVDNAMSLITDKMPAPSQEQLRSAILLAQKECVSAGLTHVHDMGVDQAALNALRGLDESGDLRLRVYALLDGGVEDLAMLMGDGPRLPKDGASRLTVRAVKFFVDGALGSRGAALLKPYSDEKASTGILVTAPDVLEARIRTAAERGYQVATHAIGDRGNRIVLDIYERVFGEGIQAARPRIEHAQILHPDDIPRFGRGGIIASMQPTHATSDMPWAEKRVGKARLEGAYAWRSLLSTNATIAAGSDAPVEDISPVLGLYAAITRKDMFGSPNGGWMPHEKMTPLEAVHAFTAGGAYASFRENEAGRLKPGFVADMIVLDQDPFTSSEDDLSGLQVMLTMIGGNIEFARPGADAPPAPPAPPPPPEARPEVKPADSGLDAKKAPSETKTSSTSTTAGAK